MASMTIIPQDIITTHILCRLPPKSIGRFRCVSKEWLSLLSEPRFIQTHRKMLNRNHFIFRSNHGSLYSSPFNDHEAVSTLTKLHEEFYYQINSILGSVNGLVLASTYKNLHNNDCTLLVLNLTTSDYVELPISSQNHYFDMSGFGYDSVSDDYKVVTMNCEENVYVYSLRANTWKQGSHLPYVAYYGYPSGVFLNGFLHWIFDSYSKSVIVAFSLADETLSELPPPILYNGVDIMSDYNTKLVAPGEIKACYIQRSER